jgi:hypothetical protein
VRRRKAIWQILLAVSADFSVVAVRPVAVALDWRFHRTEDNDTMGKTKQRATTATTSAGSLDERSQEFVGQWNRLISTTNWEKGQIIHQWRTALQQTDADAAEYSDEAWSRRVGNVSPQHVGRLRRVYERFGEVWHDYDGLYWTHFQSALDWHDAEMWLEGAVQSGWSVSQMRAQRWETLGAPPDKKPRDEDIVSAELDEDVSPAFDSAAEPSVSTTLDTVRDPGDDESFGPDFGDEGSASDGAAGPIGIIAGDDDEETQAAAEHRVRPFAALPELPEDLAEAFESFKLAILHHKMDGWREVARDDVLSTLDALKELALAP